MNIQGLSGRTADVNTQDELLVASVGKSMTAKNTEQGLSWSIPFAPVAAGAADVVYLRNTGNTVLAITRMVLISTAAITLEVRAVTGTAAGGTAITPVSRRVDRVRSPSGQIESAASITGLTSAGVLERIQTVANTVYQVPLSDDPILIPESTAVAINLSGAATLRGNLTLTEVV